MVNKDIIQKGQKKVKQLEGGIHENLALIRKALNELCDEEVLTTPPSLIKLNELFEEEDE